MDIMTKVVVLVVVGLIILITLLDEFHRRAGRLHVSSREGETS